MLVAAISWAGPAVAIASALGDINVWGGVIPWLSDLVQAGYVRTPALVLVLPALLVVPISAVCFLLKHRLTAWCERRRAIRDIQESFVSDEISTTDVIPAWRTAARLLVDGIVVGGLPLGGRMIRIGRHEDNDIRLPHATVHRYHALIRRDGDDIAFVITDLSGQKGNGMRINGERLAEAELADGDLIELGAVRIRFASTPML